MSYRKTKMKKRLNSPDPEVRQRERDRFMERYLNGEEGEIPESPSEIYTKNWRDRGDGGLIDKRRRGNLIKNGDYMGQSSRIYHNGSDQGSYVEQTCGWSEPGPRRLKGKVTPEDEDNLRRIDSEPIGDNSFVSIKENQLAKIISECISNYFRKNRR